MLKLPPLPPYLRLLGATETGLKALPQIQHQCPLPLSASLARLQEENPACAAVARAEAAAGDFYALCLQRPRPCGEEYRFRLVKPAQK